MQGLYEEINQIPAAARNCLEQNRANRLPENVPYLGMGSSYFAPLSLFYAGLPLQPFIASEYYSYLAKEKKSQAVLISQSGESSETLWNIEKFEEIVAVTNNRDSSLAKSEKTKTVIELHAGEERYSSTKTYVNTLVALYSGFGIDTLGAIAFIGENSETIKQTAREQAEQIFEQIKKHDSKGFYVLGSGANIGTAAEAALTLTETTKLPWNGMPVAQYDHGIKEAGAKAVIIACDGYGNEKRVDEIYKSIAASQPLLIKLGQPPAAETISPIFYIYHLNWIMNFLADYLGIKDIFQFGGKVTTVSD